MSQTPPPPMEEISCDPNRPLGKGPLSVELPVVSPEATNSGCFQMMEQEETVIHGHERHVPPRPAVVVPLGGVSGGGGGAGGSSSGGDYNSSNGSMSLMKQEEEKFYSAPDNHQGDDNIWGLLSGVGGNIYEWYDFAVYGLMAPEIGACFFPTSSPRLQLIESFGVYLAAFLMRPLGAILFGEIGDRLFGRKHALVMSIVLITVPSVAMGMLPGYDLIGPAAPILLILLRMLQGLSVGGQLAGSYVLSIEQSTATNRGFRGSICDASAVGGFLLATAVSTVVRSFLTEEEVNEWGWRAPFWFSLLIAPALYHIVKQTEESKFWSERTNQKEHQEEIREQAHQTNPAVMDLLASPFRRRQLAGMIGILGTCTSGFYMIFMWTPLYLANLRGLISEKEADLMTFWIVAIYIILLIICGKLSDNFPHRVDLIKIGLAGVIVASPTMFGMFESESFVGFFLAQLQFAVVLSFLQGGMAAFEVELWMADPSLSFTGVAVGHNIAATVFGGSFPLIATALYYWSDDLCASLNTDDDAPNNGMIFYYRLIPGLFVTIIGLISLYCVNYLIRHPHDIRTGDKKSRDLISAEKKKKQIQSQLSTTNGTYTPPT